MGRKSVKKKKKVDICVSRSLDWKDPLQTEMTTHLVFLPGESHVQRSLAGYSPWGHTESDMTEVT